MLSFSSDLEARREGEPSSRQDRDWQVDYLASRPEEPNSEESGPADEIEWNLLSK